MWGDESAWRHLSRSLRSYRPLSWGIGDRASLMAKKLEHEVILITSSEVIGRALVENPTGDRSFLSAEKNLCMRSSQLLPQISVATRFGNPTRDRPFLSAKTNDTWRQLNCFLRSHWPLGNPTGDTNWCSLATGQLEVRGVVWSSVLVNIQPLSNSKSTLHFN